jgi:hypothetical protein
MYRPVARFLFFSQQKIGPAVPRQALNGWTAQVIF